MKANYNFYENNTAYENNAYVKETIELAITSLTEYNMHDYLTDYCQLHNVEKNEHGDYRVTVEYDNGDVAHQYFSEFYKGAI